MWFRCWIRGPANASWIWDAAPAILTAQIAESGARVTGVDRSAEMVAAARLAYPNLKFEISDATKLAYREEFDAVFSNATLHWIHEPELVLQGVWKALRAGGRFVAEFGGRKNIRAMQDAFDRALVELGAATAEEVQPWYYPSVSEYSTLAEKNGFEVRLITLFDRPTGLADGAAGMRNWIVMFGADYLAKAGEARREEFLRKVDEMLRPKLFRDGQWWADYRRLRLVAYKQRGLQPALLVKINAGCAFRKTGARRRSMV
jgi:trans-aconitate methyltransferase